MKTANRIQILRLLRRKSQSRSELSAETGLTRAAMSTIIGKLLQEEVVSETRGRRSAAGRRPVPVELRADYAYSLGLTISRVAVEVGLADFRGMLISRIPVDVRRANRAEALRRIKAALEGAMKEYPGARWLGLGISTPGPVDVATATVLSPPNFEMWHDACLRDEFKDLGIGNIFLENNAQALTMAEKSFGIGRMASSFVLIEVEAGIGGGLVFNGEIYSGWGGFGNEIGHISIDQNGPQCKCGLRGCVELYSAPARILTEVRKKHPGIRNWEHFIDRAIAGEPYCKKVLAKQAQALSTAIVNVINVLELDAVVLTGDILYRGELLRSEIERLVNEFAINRQRRQVPVYLSPLGERPELKAAAGIPAEKFFQGLVEPVRLKPNGSQGQPSARRK
ncbi:MAG: ROK family transcriptional regulator [Formivibrio sp.]|nr:ROK family transcriptional regulator [Formivibrio sp.]